MEEERRKNEWGKKKRMKKRKKDRYRNRRKKDWKLRIKEEGVKPKNVKGKKEKTRRNWWSNNDEVYCDNYSWVRFDEMFTIYKFCCNIYVGVRLDVIFTLE